MRISGVAGLTRHYYGWNYPWTIGAIRHDRARKILLDIA